MKYLKFLLATLVLVFFSYYYFVVYEPRKQAVPYKEQLVSADQKQWETKIDDQIPVTITVTPIEFGQGAPQWRFSVVFDTHSGSLDQDPTAVISLIDDTGNVYRPIAWEGSEPGGHHREGILIFNRADPTTKYVEMKVENVGGITERLFRWSLK